MKEKEKKEKFMSFNTRDWKGFTFRSGPVKSKTNQNSSFWLSQNVENDFFVLLTGPLLNVKPLKSLELKLIYFFLSFIL